MGANEEEALGQAIGAHRGEEGRDNLILSMALAEGWGGALTEKLKRPSVGLAK
jgi:hypothetical protein